MKRAVLKVVKHNRSIRGVAAAMGLAYATLRKYVYKYKTTEKQNRKKIRFSPNYEVNLVFSRKLETELEQYILMARKLHYGLTMEIIKRLSYDLAVKHKLKVPVSWKENKEAGKHWLYGYLKRHPQVCEILNWSKKFRPPCKKQFNTTVELANTNSESTLNYDDGIEELPPVSTRRGSGSEPVVIIPLKKKKKI